MEIIPQEIVYFKAFDGREPFRDWLLSLRNSRTRQKVKIRVTRVQLGNFGDWASVGNGVFELRIHFGPGYRVYFGKMGNQIVVLLGGGDKQSQAKDIGQAHVYWEEYRRQFHEAT